MALRDLPAEHEVRAALERIETAARRGSDLTRQMLAYAGEGSVLLERVDLNAIIQDVRELLHPSPGQRVRYELGRGLPTTDADPTQLRQVVMNLVINACEALGDGDGAIVVRTSSALLNEVDLKEMHHGPAAAPGPHLCLEVADTGCGMDSATMARVFDPFFSTKFSGRGLGLATVLGAVRGHGGAVRITSEPGRGTTFCIYLPYRSRTASPPASLSGLVPSSEGRTVLLIDDEEDVRAVTAHMLERLGCSVLLASDGREGVEVFRERSAAIDTVILDLTLPRLGGEQALHEIRSIRSDARVIVMSGYSDEKARRRLTEAGMVAFLRKPFSVADLRSTMR
jgi:CheY-like chemotaxis protein